MILAPPVLANGDIPTPPSETDVERILASARLSAIHKARRHELPVVSGFPGARLDRGAA
jgi:hypothetical protein